MRIWLRFLSSIGWRQILGAVAQPLQAQRESAALHAQPTIDHVPVEIVIEWLRRPAVRTATGAFPPTCNTRERGRQISVPRQRSWSGTANETLAHLCSFSSLAASARAQSGGNRYPFKPVPLADSAEIALAVSPLPPEVYGQATVYAVRDGNVLTLREGSNGVACMVGRDLHEGGLYPICFNAEGARTAIQRELMPLRFRSLGVAEDSMDRAVSSAYARGELGVPRELALAYIMSPRQVLFSSPAATGGASARGTRTSCSTCRARRLRSSGSPWTVRARRSGGAPGNAASRRWS